VDHKTLNDETVTLRYRDSMEQDRIPVKNIEGIVSEKVNMKKMLKALNA
jgi:glycyl-tRNA synthetase